MHQPAVRKVTRPDTIRRAALLPDEYVLQKADADIVGHLLNGRNFSYSVKNNGKPVTWGAFGTAFRTLGELRRIAAEHPHENAEPEPETVGLDLFANMLDTIAFLRVRLRALADVCIERGVVTGPELLAKYHEAHERSFQAFRDLMLLRPDVFEARFAEWLATEHEYRRKLQNDQPSAVEV